MLTLVSRPHIRPGLSRVSEQPLMVRSPSFGHTPGSLHLLECYVQEINTTLKRFAEYFWISTYDFYLKSGAE